VSPFPRRVEPEQLDSLPATDPESIRSRRDLQRLNVIMGQAASLARIIRASGAAAWMRRIVDLGGSDGTILLDVARRLAPRLGAPRAVVVDRHPCVTDRTRDALRALEWELEVAATDVWDWLVPAPGASDTVTIANLFLHHFEDQALRMLLARIAATSRLFVASDPRRSGFTLAATHCIGLLGCGPVTRRDGLISVRAGFRGRELSALWPVREGWQIDEGETGPFSHYFVASRPEA
jgi:hypothetical protein